MTRHGWRAAWVVAFCTSSVAAFSMDAPITATQITTYKNQPVDTQVDGLIWRGGIVMQSARDDFGGLSGITFTGMGHQLAMVTDEGNFVTGHLIYDDGGHPLGIGGGMLYPIKNSKGVELPRQFARDAEAIETIMRDGKPAAVRVGFENLTRVADFDLENGRPTGAATEVWIPEWLEQLRNNTSLESVCIAPPASPVAGSTILITESAKDGDGFAGYMLGNADRGNFSVKPTSGLNPTDCAFLPDGDLLILERGTSLISFTMQVRRVPAAEVKPGNMLDGEVILTGAGSDIDNMEGIAVHEGPNGETRIAIISDDNFNSWERTLLLEFSLPN